MRIPSRLSDLLETNDKLNGAVLQTISILRPWFEDNKLVFFPEYTDHGPKHVQEVFETTESLITETAWPLLRSDDVATLILGIILHDCAMHLSEDGFVTLVTGGARPLDAGFGDKPWPQLWDEFMAEARRFDERKLKALFDDVEPVRAPPLNPIKMEKRDRLLIGEFLRRHHPRLAHEIALSGVPGPASKGLALGDLPENVKHLGGLVARSHGLDLRVSVDYLNRNSKWGARRTRGVHVTYLMVLVRVADYLQIHSSRAPQEVLQVRSLRSPVSRGAWDAHDAIKDIHQETDDPEALWIEGHPENVETYLKLKYLLADIQREIDDSWAVLGEVYGPKEELRGFGVRLRRIKSNLDDPAFQQTVSYVPCQAALHTAGVDLLKLLITPLYGDRPEVGIRELLQNAVDACRELKDYLEKNPQLGAVDLTEQSADVVIELHAKEDGSKWITVSDRGIGMTVDTILNYFLKAGASFRNSFAWRKQHEDEDGGARVLRSGRFGIGVLAGFLLGHEIQVSTRHITAAPHEGISFTCRLEDEHIELTRITRSVGTTVSIQIPERVYIGLVVRYDDEWDFELFDDEDEIDEINWDWYRLTDPLVSRLTPKGQLLQIYTVPASDSTLPSTWRRISHSDYQDIHWTHSAFVHDLTCNGIAITDLSNSPYYNFDKRGVYRDVFESHGLFCPILSVFDPHGNFPLNLQRTALSANQLPFQSELIKDICLDILAYFLVHTPLRRPSYKSLCKIKELRPGYSQASLEDGAIRHPSVRRSFSYYYTNQGVALLDPWNVQQSKAASLCCFSDPELVSALGKNVSNSFLDRVTPYGAFRIVSVHPDVYFIGWIRVQGWRLLLTDSLFADFMENKPSFDLFSDGPEWRKEKWRLFSKGECGPMGTDLDRVITKMNGDESRFLLTIYPSQETEAQSPLAEAWKDVIRLPYIPYNLAKRKKQLAHAYERLSTYIELWERTKSEEEE